MAREYETTEAPQRRRWLPQRRWVRVALIVLVLIVVLVVVLLVTGGGPGGHRPGPPEGGH
jgi:energy-coupling factor transporter transmembrane protein EcfT